MAKKPKLKVVKAKPWQRLPKETAPAFAAFQKYLKMGPKRSLAAVSGRGKGKKQASGNITRWSMTHLWVSRASAYDEHLASIAQGRAEDAIGDRAEIWAHRRADLREQEWDIAAELLTEARAALKRLVAHNEKHNVPMAPIDIARFIELSDKLSRLSAEMAHGRLADEQTTDDLRDELTAFMTDPVAMKAIKQLNKVAVNND